MARVSSDAGGVPDPDDPESGAAVPAEEEPGAGEPDRTRPWIKLAALVALVAAALLAARLTPLGDLLSRDGVDRVIESLRGSAWAPLLFILLYAGATAVAIPGTILTLAGGALFGTLWGTVYNSIAANLGANAAFLIARFLGRDAVERIAGDRLSKLDRATEAHGFRGLFTLRLLPFIPFNALNFGSGLTSMSWAAYAGATALGILPGTFVYTFFADSLLAGSQEASREALLRVALSGGLLILLSFLPTILKKMNVKLPGAALVVFALLAVSPDSGETRPAPTLETPMTADAALPDHASFTEILQGVVEDDLVDYARLDEEYGEALDAYLATLAEVDPRELEAADPDARLAFWINAYNACMLDLVVAHYPIEKSGGILSGLTNALAGRPDNSVWQIDDVFGREHCAVAGEERSQDEIEHEVIRPMGDPRIHFAVNCAAMSCPRLTREAYVGPELDAQLDARVREFIGDEEHFRLEDDVLRLNKVLDWYSEDFGGVEGLRDFFGPYLSGDRAGRVADPETEILFMEYDWTLNDVSR